MRKRLLYRSESTLLTPRPALRRAARSILLGPLFKRISGGLYIGNQNKAYLQHMGVPDAKLFFSPYAVENERFVSAAIALSPRRLALQSAFGLDSKLPVLLFSGKFIPKKQPFLLLKAYSLLRAHTPCQLLLVGDGPLRGSLEQYVLQAGLRDVHFAGFLNQSRISEAYAAADVLVLPSAFDETWGLVINEAMCFRLPVVASDRVGGVYNLVDDGVTGYRFRFDDLEDLHLALCRVLGSSAERARMGSNAFDRVSHYSIPAAADGIIAAIES
jgi:glycosyltransferase involved in cell wall biosynthesis